MAKIKREQSSLKFTISENIVDQTSAISTNLVKDDSLSPVPVPIPSASGTYRLYMAEGVVENTDTGETLFVSPQNDEDVQAFLFKGSGEGLAVNKSKGLDLEEGLESSIVGFIDVPVKPNFEFATVQFLEKSLG